MNNQKTASSGLHNVTQSDNIVTNKSISKATTQLENLLLAIKEYSNLAQPLNPEAADVNKLSLPVFNYVNKFLNEIDKAHAFIHQEAAHNSLTGVDAHTASIENIIHFIETHLNNGLNTASPNHFGYIPAGGIYASALADYIVSVINRYPTVYFCAPAIVQLENSMIQWLCSLFQYGEKAGGVFTSGGSMATLTAIIAARDKYELTQKDLSKMVIYVTKYSHHCIHKSIKAAGLSRIVTRIVNADNSFKMDVSHLHELIESDLQQGLMPWMVVGTLGTTDTGAIDPIDEIEHIGHQYNMWVHVDAAYGGFFMLTEKLKTRFKNFHQVDSIVVDPHKSMFLPYGISALLVKDVSCLLACFSHEASYLRDYTPNLEDISPADLSLELTRNFRGLKLWLPLKLYGVEPFKAALEEKLLLTQYFYNEIQKIEGIEVVCMPELSIVAFRYLFAPDVDQFNAALVKAIQTDGSVFLSSTLIEGHVYLRMACLSFRSHLENIQLAIRIINNKITQLNTNPVSNKIT